MPGGPIDYPSQNLHNVLVIAPKLVVPASAGFRFHGDLAWLNRFLFPVSRQLFLRDLRPLAPELPAAALDPGDAVEIRLEGVRIRREASEVAVTRARELVYGLEVVYPAASRETRAWALDFRAVPPTVHTGLLPEANVVHRLAASILTD